MSRPDELGRLIAAAAKAALLPLGCQRIGRSRSWISDERYWLIVIEFQPSSWQKGSYLNVGAMWLWRAREEHAFHVGYRIADFAPYYNPEQFSSTATVLATQAAEEVLRLREQFKSIHHVYRYLVDHTPETRPDIFHAAIAAGLVRDFDTASRLFQKYADIPTHGYDWVIELNAKIAKLAAQLDRPELFRRSVLEVIQECRSLIQLPVDWACLDSLEASPA